ncbi:MAG: NCS2 family permease [bacterium]|nr:NCS2 family permease [bacterium]
MIHRFLERHFQLAANGTHPRQEAVAGLSTFLTMSYIIFVQPAVLSGAMFGFDSGMDIGAITTATCLSAAIATLLMGLWARYPIALAPGMGANFFFILTVVPAASAAGFGAGWQTALGVIFIAGLLFLLITLSGLRAALMQAVSPALKNGIAVGIGLFIAFVGLRNAGLILNDPATAVALNTSFASPDLIVFFFGLLLTAGLHARRVTGAILWGIAATTLLAVMLHFALPALWAPGASGAETPAVIKESQLMTRFAPEGLAGGPLSLPPSLGPTLMAMDLAGAITVKMLPFIIIFLFIDVFDTMGTLVAVSEQGGFVKDNRLVRGNQAFLSDAVGTLAGAAMGTSTVTAYIESITGIIQGGRTGLTAVVTAACFLLALFFSPLVAVVGSYSPITAPALVIVGSMMLQNIKRIDLDEYSEAIPAFIIILGIPLSYSIADGIALGFMAYPVVKLIAGRGRDVSPIMYGLAVLLALYFLFLRGPGGGA